MRIIECISLKITISGCSWLYNGGGSSYDCTSPDAYLYDLISCTSTSSLDGTTCTGIKQCLGTGWTSCQNSIIEVCDNMDNDCNGIKDDNAVCPSGQTCVNGACTGTCSPLKEICNDKIDNDCDGKIDAEDSLPYVSSLSKMEMSLGNIKDEGYSLLNIWRNSPKLWQLRELSSDLQKRCNQCDSYNSECSGFTLEMELYRKLYNKNPFCKH